MKNRQTILIAEDNRMVRGLIRRTFEMDYRVLTTESGEEALELASLERPDLIVLDILMPGISGHEVLRRLKADERLCDTPVVFLTGMTEPDEELMGLELGAVDYWTKPFRPGIIRARARNYLELKQSRDALSQLAYRDGLTGIANRRSFDDTLEREWRRTRRSGDPLTVVLADIDNFKAYNDTRGHGAGDECLRQVAETVQGCMMRASDFAARYGGEEFVFVLSGTDKDGGLTAAEKIRTAVEQSSIPHGASDVSPYVTLSLGVASVIPCSDISPCDVLEMADRALYRAKLSGRNSVHLAN